MNENTDKLIRDLALKLGTTAEYLWAVLVQQALVSAIADLIFIILLSIFWIVFYSLHRRYTREDKYYDSDTLGFVVGLIGGVIGLFTIVAVPIFFFDMINGFFNPKYWALKEILSTLKS